MVRQAIVAAPSLAGRAHDPPPGRRGEGVGKLVEVGQVTKGIKWRKIVIHWLQKVDAPAHRIVTLESECRTFSLGRSLRHIRIFPGQFIPDRFPPYLGRLPAAVKAKI